MALLRSSGMLSKEQLEHLSDRFTFLTSQPNVEQRIKEAVIDKQGTTCCGLCFCKCCADFEPDEFAEKIQTLCILQEQQLEMLKQMRKS